MALNAVMFPFARHQFGWDYRPFSLFLSYQSLLRLVGVGVVLPTLLRSGWVARVGGSRGVIAAALSCRACELLCFVLATRGWQLFAIGGECTNVYVMINSIISREMKKLLEYQFLMWCNTSVPPECCTSAPCSTGLTLLTALAEPLLRAAMVACILPADNGALQGALSAGNWLHRASLKSTVSFQHFAVEKRHLNSRDFPSAPLAVRTAAHDARRRAMDHGAAVSRGHANRTFSTLSGMLLHRGGTGFRSLQWDGEYRAGRDHVWLESLIISKTEV